MGAFFLGHPVEFVAVNTVTKMNSKGTLIAVCYHPTSSDSRWLEAFDDFLDKIHSTTTSMAFTSQGTSITLKSLGTLKSIQITLLSYQIMYLTATPICSNP